jgi:hypothetical protein
MSENMTPPAGKERTIRKIGGLEIDGAPLSYVITLSAVVAALAFIPFSVILVTGGSFPLSQAVLSLLGWILGPVAGAVASAIGTLVGVVVAPHTARIWVLSIYGAAITSFAAGAMRGKGNRRLWWVGVAVLSIVSLAIYTGRAVISNGAPVSSVALGSFLDWSAVLLFVLPTRKLVGSWIGGKNLGLLAAGLFVGIWVTYGIGHVCQSAFYYWIYNWPAEVWLTLAPVIPVEMMVRCITGTVIGTGVITGMRAVGLVRPAEALY